jgi:CRISPR-associated protein Cmr2
VHGYNKMTYVFTVSIGPVQDFIASARRSRDLRFGSGLLSELSKAAAHEVAAGDVSRLVFPSPDRPEDLEPKSGFNVANKIVAVVDEKPEAVGEKVRGAVLRRLLEITENAFGRLEGDFDNEMALAQVTDLPEVVWAAVELSDGQGDGYARARSAAEALLAARKTTRDFRQAAWGKDVPKSSLDGQRESVIPEPVFRSMSADELRRRYGVREGERLCGVGLLKRHGSRGDGDRFFSTSHVASLPLIESIAPGHAAEVRGFAKTLESLGVTRGDMGNVPGAPHPAFGSYDGHLLFAERLREYLPGEETLAAARSALEQFLSAAAGGRRPIPYYALLLADGDRMGKIIDSQRDVGAHRRLSRALAGYAGKARDIVESHKGSLIYAGGDDVLAFAPLHTVLLCARQLAETFRTSMKGFRDLERASPTLSVGVAVAHHLNPLSDTLALARSAEKRAKAFPGKNALDADTVAFDMPARVRSAIDASTGGGARVSAELAAAATRYPAALTSAAGFVPPDFTAALQPGGKQDVNEFAKALSSVKQFSAAVVLTPAGLTVTVTGGAGNAEQAKILVDVLNAFKTLAGLSPTAKTARAKAGVELIKGLGLSLAGDEV